MPTNDLGSVILASSVNNKDVEMVAANGVNDLRHDVAQSESEVKEAIQIQTAQRVVETLSLHDRICEVEKEALAAKYEARLETLNSTKEIKDSIHHFEEEVDEELCEIRRQIDNKFAQAAREDLENELDELKQESLTTGIVAQVLKALGK